MRTEMILIVGLCWRMIDGKPHQTRPGCWYEGKRYQESQVVNTTEPCLRCRCNEGSLRCRLRVCPRLPSPPPSGCATRYPRDNACCAELVCGDSHESNVTARRDPSKDIRSHDNGCLHEGVRYGPGSAMMGSRRCEYCYCISGNRRCLRPRCLLPLAGCTPLYAPHSCCPVAYNCTNSAHHSVPSPGSPSFGNGCRVDSRTYDEGEMVRDIAHKSECDNCFCAMGGVRCVPLSCAPPLQGCTPIVREGHCCPSTYNCSGSIEVKATQNYASYAFISKDYAKFRKETNFFSMETDDSDYAEPKNLEQEELYEEYDSIVNSTVEGRGHKNHRCETSSILLTLENATKFQTTVAPTVTTENYISVETTLYEKTSTVATTNETTTIFRDETETMNNEIQTEITNYDKSSTTEEETTATIEDSTIYETTEFSETTNFESNEFTTTESTILDDYETSSGQTESVVTVKNDSEIVTSIFEISTIVNVDDESSSDRTTISSSTTTSNIRENVDNIFRVTINCTETVGSTIVDSTDFSKSSNFSGERYSGDKDISESLEFLDETVVSIRGSDGGPPTTIIVPQNILVMNVTLKTNVSVGDDDGDGTNPVRSIPPDIEAILNMTNRRKGEDYDYEYSRPTLPPSLPNVRIIPFVAADALVNNDEEDSEPVTSYPMGSVGLSPPELGPTVAGTMANFYDIATQENRFSPPVQTEGGFLPREPPYFDPLYNPSDLNLEIRTGVTVVSADITDPYRENDEQATNCRFENRDFRHGDVLPSSGHCIICICYYGEVTCSDEKCPPLKIGCRRIENEKICCGEIVCVDSDESPTVVLDRGDPVAASPRQPLPAMDGIASPDPFRDVIRTEPAPDLPSLMEDMPPYLADRRLTKPSTTPMTASALESNVHGHYQLEPDENFPIVTDDHNVYSINREQPEKFQIHENSNNGYSTIDNPLETTSNRSKISISTPVEQFQNENSHEPSKFDNPQNSSFISFDDVFDIFFSDNAKTSSTRIFDGSKNFEETTETTNWEETKDSTAADSSMKIGESGGEKILANSSFDGAKMVGETITEKTGIVRTDNVYGNSIANGSSDNDIATSVNSLLKLAGCNIYGRMYRVGRIITELSSPCLECRCTEVGVQCKQLEC